MATMNTKLIIACALAFNLVVLWCLAHRYEFHTGMDGGVIWRCNNFTGKVERCSIGSGKWFAISAPKPFVPPSPDEITKPTSSIPGWAKDNNDLNTNKPIN
jgi:hypothetical protein